MNELTVSEIEDKIKKVEEDLRSADTENARMALTSYIDYLQDELKEAKLNGRY